MTISRIDQNGRKRGQKISKNESVVAALLKGEMTRRMTGNMVGAELPARSPIGRLPEIQLLTVL